MGQVVLPLAFLASTLLCQSIANCRAVQKGEVVGGSWGPGELEVVDGCKQGVTGACPLPKAVNHTLPHG